MPIHSRGIVGVGLGGLLANVKTLCGCFVVEEASSEFQFRVVDGSIGVAEGNQCLLNGSWKGGTPKYGDGRGGDGRFQFVTTPVNVEDLLTRGGCLAWEPDAASSYARGIVSTNKNWGSRNEFLQSGWTGGELGLQPTEVVDGIVKAAVESAPSMLQGLLCHLEVAEETTGAGEC